MPQAINTLRRLIAVEHKQLGKLCALTDDVMACLRNLEHFDDDVQAYVNRVNAGVQKKREDGDARRQEQQGEADVPAQHEQVRAQLSELGVSEDACAAAFAALGGRCTAVDVLSHLKADDDELRLLLGQLIRMGFSEDASVNAVACVVACDGRFTLTDVLEHLDAGSWRKDRIETSEVTLLVRHEVPRWCRSEPWPSACTL